jgi:hypothetical protein
MNTTSAPQTVTLSNVGSGPLSISSIALSGTNSGDFAQTNNCPGSLMAGGNCAINVTFTPAAGGTRSASIAVADNATGSPQTVVVGGIGFVGPIVSLSATSLNFARTQLGSASAAQTVTLTNTGYSALDLSQVGPGTGDYIDFEDTFDNCFNAVVPPGGTCGVTLAFAPETAGQRTATWAFYDNALNSPQSLSLSGTGAQPPTPPGTYSVGVMGMGGATTLIHQVTITVTVQ